MHILYGCESRKWWKLKPTSGAISEGSLSHKINQQSICISASYNCSLFRTGDVNYETCATNDGQFPTQAHKILYDLCDSTQHGFCRIPTENWCQGITSPCAVALADPIYKTKVVAVAAGNCLWPRRGELHSDSVASASQLVQTEVVLVPATGSAGFPAKELIEPRVLWLSLMQQNSPQPSLKIKRKAVPIVMTWRLLPHCLWASHFPSWSSQGEPFCCTQWIAIQSPPRAESVTQQVSSSVVDCGQ